MIKIIFCILGPSGAGKSTIAREVSKQLNIEIVVSYTSRPIRPNETNGVDYHFVDNQHFEDNAADFIEMREYQVYDGSIWKYGFKESSFQEDTDYLVVIETDGYNALKRRFGDYALYPFLIESPIEDLYARISKRGDNPQEMIRRLEDDAIKFENFANKEKCDIIMNCFNLEFAINLMVRKIRRIRNEI